MVWTSKVSFPNYLWRRYLHLCEQEWSLIQNANIKYKFLCIFKPFPFFSRTMSPLKTCLYYLLKASISKAVPLFCNLKPFSIPPQTFLEEPGIRQRWVALSEDNPNPLPNISVLLKHPGGWGTGHPESSLPQPQLLKTLFHGLGWVAGPLWGLMLRGRSTGVEPSFCSFSTP